MIMINIIVLITVTTVIIVMVAKARYFTKEAETKIKEAGGVCVLCPP